MRILHFLLIPALLFAEGTKPKEKPSEYPVHTVAGDLVIAAEYNVRSFGSGTESYWTEDYLVVEVALYRPSSLERVMVQAGAFSLRLNGKKEVVRAQGPEFVAASLKYSDWESQRRIQAGVGMGDTGVILGRPRPQERFPGDPDVSGRSRLPNPPRAPETRPGGVDKQAARTAPEVAVDQALAQGERVLPISGYLYFPFKGKPKSLKSVELIFQHESGAATLKLK